MMTKDKLRQLIRKRCQGYDPAGLSKGDASQIINRLFNEPKKRGMRLCRLKTHL